MSGMGCHAAVLQNLMKRILENFQINMVSVRGGGRVGEG